MRHAEVLALQKQLGISYKDAAHRLYMAEVERVKKSESAARGFAGVWERLENLISSDIIPPIHALDKGEFDDYIWEDGEWKKKKQD